MRWLPFVLILFATPVFAQDEPGFLERLFGTDTAENDVQQGSLLERLIEDSLSGAGRSVTVTGFSGALSGAATLESLTISDADGTWLTLNDATLNWSRAALFAGRLEVAELSAAEILLPRLAAPAEGEAPSPEASAGFQLPDLPVSVNIGRIAAERVELGEALFGVQSVISLEGALSLADGNGVADLEIIRLDRPGAIRLDAGYQNATEALRLDLSMVEEEGGIIATLAGLPGAPSVDFSVQGDAPLSDFTADLRLATEGEERLQGQIRLSETDEARRITANLSGDIAPVFAPQFRDFFGNNLTLDAEALLFPDGRTVLPEFSLFARELALFGSFEVGADGLPEKIDITGRIAPETDATVLLPAGGAETEIARANLIVQFDAAQSEDYNAAIRLEGLARDGLSADEVILRTTGRIGEGTPPEISADLDFDVTGFATSDGLSDALGPALAGNATIGWAGGPVTVNRFTLNARDLRAQGAASLESEAVRMTAAVSADRLANFAGLANRALAGQATLEVEGSLNPLTQAFEVAARGQTVDLAIGDPRADAVLAGTADLDVSAIRDTEALRIDLRTLESPAANLTGQASLRSGGSSAAIEGRLIDTALVLPGVAGATDFTFAGQEDENRNWSIATTLAAPSLNAEIAGLLSNLYDLPTFQGTVSADSQDISPYSRVAGRPLAGRLELQAEGGANADLTRVLIDGSLASDGLAIGDERLDPILGGNLALTLEGGRTDDRVDIVGLSLASTAVNADVSGVVTDLTGNPSFDGEISASAPDLALFAALAQRDLGGAVTLEAEGAANADLTSAGIVGNVSADGLAIGDARIDPLLQGRINLAVDAERAGDRVDISKLSLEGSAVSADVAGILTDLTSTPAFDGRVSTDAADLAVFSGLADRPLSGQLDLSATAAARADLSLLRVDGDVTGQDIAVGIAEVDRMLSGPVALSVDAGRDGDQIDVSAFSFRTNTLTAETSGQFGNDGDQLNIEARLNDVAPYVPGFRGPLSVEGIVGRSGDRISVDVDANGPGGSQAAVTGTVAQDASSADLGITGTAPLALANRFIAPRSLAGTTRFDLRLNGAPALESVSGTVALNDARLADPTLPTGLENISGTIALNAARATLDISTDVETGGRIALSGPVGLTAPNSAGLRIGLKSVRLTDPQLYETVANGQIAIEGPLAGGASIAGTINLGETNVQIPSSGLGGAGAIPEITHLREPPPVRGTRRKAGLLERDNNSARGTGPVFPLDIRISAPSRIFVRGRGLDSEFGGALRIVGSTANIIPSGAFELIRGRLDILGNRLALDEARVTIQGGFIPVLNIRASTDVDDTEVNVNVLGPADSPEIRFTSSPELPQEEVLARLIFGRGLETLSPIQAARLAVAVRTLAGRGGEGIVGNIRGTAGLADLDVTTNEDGNAAVRAGAYLGENIYSDVTVDSEGETQLNLNLDVSPSLTVRGGVSNEGDSSLGIFFERDY